MAEGTHVSEGKFTVNQAARLKTVGQLVRLQPCIFLGRLLQAATVGDSSGVRYSVTQKGMKILISLSDHLAYESLPEYFAGKAPQGKVQHYLDLAFLSARALQPKKLWWSFQGPNGGHALDLLNDQHPLTLLPNAEAEATLEFEWPAPKGWLEAARLWLQGRVYVTDFLKTHCAYSTVPVTLDGQPLDFRSRFSYGSPQWMSPFMLAMSVRLEGPNCPAGGAFNALGPGCKIALTARLEGHELPELSDPAETSRAISTNVSGGTNYHQISLLQVTGPTRCQLETRSLDCWIGQTPDQDQLLAVRARTIPSEDSEGPDPIKVSQAVYFKSPECRLPFPTRKGYYFSDKCPHYRCSRFMALSKTGIAVLGRQPVRSALRLIRDGLCIANPPWEAPDGCIAVLAIPNCKMDGDEWQVVEDETYGEMLRNLAEDFHRLLADEAACRRP